MCVCMFSSSGSMVFIRHVLLLLLRKAIVVIVVINIIKVIVFAVTIVTVTVVAVIIKCFCCNYYCRCFVTEFCWITSLRFQQKIWIVFVLIESCLIKKKKTPLNMAASLMHFELILQLQLHSLNTLKKRTDGDGGDGTIRFRSSIISFSARDYFTVQHV